jgi:Holliday junction resolvase-like predicted endonuclease
VTAAEQETSQGNGRTRGQRRRANRRSEQGAVNREQGEVAEDMARVQLELLGLKRIERIQVGWKVIWGEDGRILHAFPLERVSGDFKAITPTGTAVHVEVKSRSRRDRLRYSDLEAHQVEALDEHARYGGVSLLCWATPAGEILVMQWPIPGFERYKSITIEQARRHQWPGA